MTIMLDVKISRQRASPEMIQLLRDLKKHVAIGFVGGSDFVKISDQLNVGDFNGTKLFLIEC